MSVATCPFAGERGEGAEGMMGGKVVLAFAEKKKKGL